MTAAASMAPNKFQSREAGSAPEDFARLSFEDMADDLGKMAVSKAWWLEACSSGPKKRPDHELDIQRKHLKVLQQAAADYQRAATRPAMRGAAE